MTRFTLVFLVALLGLVGCTVPAVDVASGSEDPGLAGDGKADTVRDQRRVSYDIQGEEVVLIGRSFDQTRRGFVVADLDEDEWDPGLQDLTLRSNALVFRPTDLSYLEHQGFAVSITSNSFYSYAPAFLLGVRVVGEQEIRWTSGKLADGAPGDYKAEANINPGGEPYKKGPPRVWDFTGYSTEYGTDLVEGRDYPIEDVVDAQQLEYVVLPVIWSDSWDIQGSYEYTLSFADRGESLRWGF